MTKTFKVMFHKRSLHWVSVVVHTTTAAMRSILTRRGHKDSAGTAACCWQSNNPGKDQCVAEMHFAADRLTLDHIAHESTYAAYHRTVLIGVPHADDEFQEYVAEGTGNLTDAIVALFDKEKIKVRYKTVPNRRLPRQTQCQ